MAERPTAGAYTLRKVGAYLPRFLRFVYVTFPLARVVLLLTLCLVVLEYATLSLMIPLARVGATSAAARVLLAFWGRVAAALGLPIAQQTWLCLFLLLLGLRMLFGYAQITVNTLVAKQVHAYLSDRIFRRVVEQEPLPTIFRRSIGFYISLAGDETHKAGTIFFNVGQMLAAATSALAGLALLFSFSRHAFWLTALFIVVCSALLSKGLGAILRLSSVSLELSRALNTSFIEAMNGLRSIRSLSAEAFVIRAYREQIRRYVRGLFAIDALNFGYKTAPGLILILVGAVWLWPAAGSSRDANTLFFFAITTMLIRILTALGELVTAGGKLVADVRASHDAGELLTQPMPADAGGAAPINERIARVALEGVACGYEADRSVLHEISAEFLAGRAYAIVGESGAGKSTLADVLLGILPPSRGSVAINGTPLSALDVRSLRSRMILVEQQTRIFSGPLADNVTMGLESSDAAVSQALLGACLGDFVARLPQGLRTIVDYQGSNLSGGQRQRLGIARALLRKPDVLILDEATSAVDPPLRRKLVSALRAQFADGILIFITHDGEVLAAVDEVWHIEGGVLNRGTSFLPEDINVGS